MFKNYRSDPYRFYTEDTCAVIVMIISMFATAIAWTLEKYVGVVIVVLILELGWILSILYRNRNYVYGLLNSTGLWLIAGTLTALIGMLTVYWFVA